MEFSRHQTVLHNLELRLAQIRTALTDLTDIQGELQRNALESKNNIQSNFSRQLESLRTREVYLLTQVDTLLQVKQEHLHLQAEGLKRELGALETLLDQARTAGRPVALQDIEDIMKRFQVLQLTPEEDAALSFEGDPKQLKKAILSFGYVNPKRQRLAKEDGSQTIAGQIIGAFEQFAVRQVWLCKVQKAKSGTKDDKPHMVYPVFLEKGDLATWLKKTEQPGDSSMETSDTDSEDQDSFVMIPQDADRCKKGFSTHFANILNSPNIQWIRPAPKTATVGVSPHQQRKPCSYYQPSGSTKDWLRKAPAQGREGKTMDSQVNNHTCSPDQVPAKPIEIEDLADMACVQDSPSGAPSPCAPKTSPTSMHQRRQEKNTTCCSSAKTSGIADIDEVCKGNEKCKSFEECLCDENCADAAKRRNIFTGVPESSKNQWLIRVPPAVEKGPSVEEENVQPATPDEEMPRADFVQEWLVSKTSPTSDYESSVVSSFLRWQLDDKPAWLKKVEPSGSPPHQMSFDQTPVSEWLLKKAEGSAVDNKKSSEDRQNQSEWLLPRSSHASISASKSPASDALKEKGQGLSAGSTEDAMREKWLLKQAFGMSPVGPRQNGFPYFSTPMDANQWLN